MFSITPNTINRGKLTLLFSVFLTITFAHQKRVTSVVSCSLSSSLTSDSISSKSSAAYDTGKCADLTIAYAGNEYRPTDYGFSPSDQNAFPHAWSSDIATVESLICSRLDRYCGADWETVNTCWAAFNDLSGLSGERAASRWNQVWEGDRDGSARGGSCSSITTRTTTRDDGSTAAATITSSRTSPDSTINTALSTKQTVIVTSSSTSSHLPITSSSTSRHAPSTMTVVVDVSSSGSSIGTSQSPPTSTPTSDSLSGGGSPFDSASNAAASTSIRKALRSTLIALLLVAVAEIV